MGYFISVCWMILIQHQSTTATGAEAAGGAVAGDGVAAAAEGAQRGFFQDFQYMLPIMAAIMALYFILLRPQQPDDKATGNVKNLKKNDRVLTVGGIVGTVVSSPEQSEFTTIRIDESNNTKIQVRTVSIARVMTDDDQKSGSAAAKK